MTRRPPLRVLCLDIEGGYGGSSRSLYYSLAAMDREAVAPTVWCRRDGPIQAKYRALGLPCAVHPAMPKVSSLPRLSRNLIVYTAFLRDWHRSAAFRRRLAAAANEDFDLVHFNHEALFLLARWLRRRTARPLTMHVRTNLQDSPFARWQERTIAACVDRLVFITENERANFERLAGAEAAGHVVYNVAPPAAEGDGQFPGVPCDGRFRVGCVANYAWSRGVDRLVDIAGALAARGRRDFVFVVAGTMALPRSLPGQLGRIAGSGGTLADHAAALGLGDMFAFLGPVPDGEAVIAACDVVAKPTREDNPWGRDVIEALAAGKPVLTVGTWDGFVQDGETGVLQARFDAEGMADALVALRDDPAWLAAMGDAGRARIAALCDGPARAADLAAIWADAVRRAP